MGTPVKGRADYLDLGDWNALCSMCGRKRKASTMVKNWQGQWRCPEHNEPRQPQDFVRGVPDIQTPPWTQPPPLDGVAVYTFNITEDGPFSVSVTGYAIITVQEGVTVTLLTVTGTGPVVINNYGMVDALADSSTGGLTIHDYSGGMAQLKFQVQPTDVAPDAVITPAVEVALVDNADSVITGFVGDITLAIGNNPGGGTLSGTLTVTAVAGVATFPNLSIDQQGTGYTLAASSPGTVPGATDSAAFNVVGEFTLTIDANAQNYDVYAEFVAEFGTPPDNVVLTVVVDPGIIVSATSTAAAALQWGSEWTGVPTFALINEGYIIGKGGDGGSGVAGDENGVAGGNGGSAIDAEGHDLDITNGSGNIWGGGGGGGSGAGYVEGTFYTGMSGGGGGAGNSSGGPKICPSVTTTQHCTQFSPASGWQLAFVDGTGQDGDSPTGALPGQTGAAGGITTPTSMQHLDGGIPIFIEYHAGDGGAGGNYGVAGSAGALPFIDEIVGSATGTAGSVGAGGAAGKAINLAGGSANFISGGGSPNVKGPIS